ncbi:DUF4767 domain-containing protein [Streptococcus gallolyticus]|uniref:DUF4767 domain-containing protein n=1 Tax=Streptococcus gallolyticus TaxID=315405 RepID=UPI00088BED88|nr:DUF4767 domain-containing protein [Streptococcus gallolyticus]SDK24520.1 protein of unknown function [Streptococcus gallolyticus]SDL71471.1 protein of unknown function [Streptococcus gallolyticus]
MKKQLQLGLLILLVFSLAACGKKQVQKESETSFVNAKSSQILKEDNKTEESTVNLSDSLWNDKKSQELGEFIINVWGPSFSSPQVYKEYTVDNPGSFYGFSLPNGLVTGTLIPDFSGETYPLSINQEGYAPQGGLAVVAVYSDIETAQYPTAHLYVFTISEEGDAKAWVTEQNQGNLENKLYFHETQNQELQNYFETLVKE